MSTATHQTEAQRNNAPIKGKDQLCSLAAENIMTRPVQTAYEGWSVKMLLDFFLRHSISGAPVMASDGELVGVVTMSDVMRFENLSPREKERLAGMSCYSEYFAFEFSKEDIAKMMQNADTNCTVNQIMTPSVIQVEASESVTNVAKLMREKKIHRVFVCADKKAIGVVSTSNLLDAMIATCGCDQT